MKTMVSEKSLGPVANHYPVLKRSQFSNELDYVVLFTAPRQGIVVHVFKSNDNEVVVGWDGNGGFGEDRFVEFDGAISISN